MSDIKFLYIFTAILFFLFVIDDMILRGFDYDRRVDIEEIRIEIKKLQLKDKQIDLFEEDFKNHVHRYYDGRIK